MNEQSSHLPLGLRTIALFEAAKGILALAAVCGLLSLRHTDLHAATDAFLLRHGVNPERHYTRLFIETVANATHHHAGQIIGVGIAYGLIRLAEGYGLWLGKHWAEWFAVISAGLYLPLELFHFVRRPRPFTTGIILLNVALIIYLGKLLARQRAERKLRLKANLKSAVSVLLILAFAVATADASTPGAQTAEDLPPQAGTAANSNLTGAAVPQLSASPAVVTNAPMVETPGWRATPPPGRVTPATAEARERRKTVLMVVLVLTVVAGSQLLRRLRSRSDPP